MNKLRLIFVHGISDMIIKNDYTSDLVGLLLQELEQQGIIPARATSDQIEQFITFERVNYSEIGQAEEDKVLAAYFQERNKLYNLFDKALEGLGFDALRRFLVSSVSDVLIYESELWRERIRSTLLEKIQPYIKTGDAVTVIGHSLGSVVAFDTLYYNSRHNPSWLDANFKVTNLFTMGSPIALFSLEMDDVTGEQKPRYFPKDATPANMNPANTNPDLQPVQNEGVWYNFLDAQDLIGYPLEVLFKNKFRLEDILIQTGTQPIKAHTDYWVNHEVAHRIAERLKADYKRINP